MSIRFVSVTIMGHLGVSYVWKIHALWFGCFPPLPPKLILTFNPPGKVSTLSARCHLQDDWVGRLGHRGWMGDSEGQPALIVSLVVFLRCAL